MIDLKDRLKKRLNFSDKELDQIMSLLNRYDLKLTIKNFDSDGLVLKDLKGQSVRITFGTFREKMIHIPVSHADVIIVHADNMLSGWIEEDKLNDIQDRMLVDVKSLHQMPEKFLFIQQCPHLEVHGGFFDGESWECAFCKERLIFHDE